MGKDAHPTILRYYDITILVRNNKIWCLQLQILDINFIFDIILYYLNNKIYKDKKMPNEISNEINDIFINLFKTLGNSINKVAILIDADNISQQDVEKILLQAKKFGEIAIQRAYGDFLSNEKKGWLDVARHNAINIIQTPRYVNGKNTADGVMIIDAMKICFQNKIDCFCLCSSDSDFTYLAITLKELGKKVYGFGYKQTKQPLIRACNEFKHIELIKQNLSEKETELIRKIFEENNNQPINLDDLNSKLREYIPDFHYKNYGYKDMRDFIIKKCGDLLELVNQNNNDKNPEVKLKTS